MIYDPAARVPYAHHETTTSVRAHRVGVHDRHARSRRRSWAMSDSLTEEPDRLRRQLDYCWRRLESATDQLEIDNLKFMIKSLLGKLACLDSRPYRPPSRRSG